MKKITDLNKIKINEQIILIKEEAIANNVPIVCDDTLTYILQMIKFLNVDRILEIGTAVAYSAISMALNSSAIIDSIERNQENYIRALENVKKCGLEKRITIYKEDALEIDLTKLKKSYDLIFIDAAKAQMSKFFEKFSGILSDQGIIILDNLSFHGLVYSETDIDSKNVRNMVRKIADFNIWLANKEDFVTYFFDIGDGLAVSKKKYD